MRLVIGFVLCFKQKTAYEMRISDWSSDVCSADLSIAGLMMPSSLTSRMRRGSMGAVVVVVVVASGRAVVVVAAPAESGESSEPQAARVATATRVAMALSTRRVAISWLLLASRSRRGGG